MTTSPRTKIITGVLLALALGLGAAHAQDKKPNILVIMGDDIGWFNPSIYHRGNMRYETPNIVEAVIRRPRSSRSGRSRRASTSTT